MSQVSSGIKHTKNQLQGLSRVALASFIAIAGTFMYVLEQRAKS